MAYWREKNGRKYMYDQNNAYVKALGYIDDKKADRECLDWEIDHGKRPAHGSHQRSMQAIYEEYLTHCRTERFTPKSMRTIRQCIEPFLETVPTLSDLTKQRIKAWSDKLKTATYRKGPKGPERRYAIDTIAVRLRTIQSFCSWMADPDVHADKPILEESPFRIKVPAQRKDAGRALEPKEVVGLFANWYGPNDLGNPDCELAKLFFEIVYYGGTRITEVLGDEEFPEDYPGLHGEHVSVEGGTVRLLATKDGDSREVALPEWLLKKIPTTPGPVFRGKITDNQVHGYRKKATDRAGIKGRLRDYDGRVTSATHWAEVNPSPVPKDMQDQFGWKSPAMPMHYQKVSKARRVKKAQNMVYDNPTPNALEVV